jgi:hypothetical protein
MPLDDKCQKISINDYGKEIRKSLRMDCRQRAYRVSMQIEQKMTAGDMRGAYDLL